jgi:hypothetical protein
VKSPVSRGEVLYQGRGREVKNLCSLVAMLALATTANAQKPQSESVSISFEDCLKRIRTISGQFGIAPVNIVETNDLRVARFLTSDGSLLVTCSKPDRKMVLTMSK